LKGWEIPECRVTPEHIALDRRRFLFGAGAFTAANVLGGSALSEDQQAGSGKKQEVDPTAGLYPAKRNNLYNVDRPITEMRWNMTYNNFYEFGAHKKIFRLAQQLQIRPWEIRFEGDIEKPFTIGVDELISKMSLEERVYRHRCVEAWSMIIPWTGFPLSALVKLANPLSKAKYIRMETFFNPKIAPGQRTGLFQASLPWPYVEGLTINEAMNDLSFMVTGAYGKPLAKQLGSPIRLHVPWKYGFKSIKSIVRIEFTSQRPKSFWEQILANEYGFWANVNPKVPHPRWSQATERVLGTNESIPTVIFNGYGAWVSDLYTNMKGERLWM